MPAIENACDQKEVSKENGYLRLECFLHNKYAPAMMRIRYGVIAFGVLFTIGSMVLTAASLKASDESPKFFGSGEHNLGDVFDMEKKFTNETLWVDAMENLPLRVCQGCQLSDAVLDVLPVDCRFVGAMCNKAPCSTQSSLEQCSGRGTCNEKTGSCSCSASWAGADCSTPRYTSQWSDCGDDVVECSGHGVCEAALCWCDLGWAGDQCKDRYSAQVGFKAPCEWRDWSEWGACSETCGLGTETRKRNANSPDCESLLGSASNERVCQMTDCPRDCAWGSWSKWSDCNVECGSGSQQRTRSIRTQPQGSGESCSGFPNQPITCDRIPCPQKCGVSEWSSAGPCDTTCGPGMQLQKREIANPGDGCPTVTQRTIPCENNPVCPETCSLGKWKDAGPCSVSCGEGVVPQRRDVVSGSQCPPADSIERSRTATCANLMCAGGRGPGPAPGPTRCVYDGHCDDDSGPASGPAPGPASTPTPAPTPAPPSSTSSSKQPANEKLPDSLVATVSVVFGLDPEKPIDRSKTIVDGTTGAPQHKDAFDFTDARLQLALFQLCNASKVMLKNKQLAVRRPICFMSDFDLWLRGRGFKGIPIVPSSMSGEALSNFLSDDRGEKWAKHAGFDYGDATRLRWFRADFLTDLPKKMPAADAWTWSEHWDDFIKEWNDGSVSGVPPGLRHAFHTSELWVRMETELRLVKSTLMCAIISLLGALFAILFFTGNIALAIYLVSVVLCIVICLAGLMFGAFGWTFGVVEAIGLIVFVGFSVDYSLHIIEAYNQSGHSARFQRVSEALLQAGSAVFAAGVTSLGASIFILFCSIKVFVQFGMVVILNTCLSMLFSLGFLCAVLMVIGPTDNFGSLYALYGWLRGYQKEDLRADDRAVSGQVLGPNNDTNGQSGPGAPSGYQWRDYDENPELKKQKEGSAAAKVSSATPAVTLESPAGVEQPPTTVQVPPTTIGAQDPQS